MKKRLTTIDPLKLGITFAIIYGVMSLIFIIPFFLIMSTVGAIGAKNGTQALPFIFSGVFMVLMPVIYAVMGFVGGVIMAFVYNLVAKWTGGVQFTTEEVL